MAKDGHNSLSQRKYSAAILNYSIVFDSILEQTNFTEILSNRSKAYLMNNDPRSAFKDAELCVLLQPEYSTGYLRKGVSFVVRLF
jgi:hypothetical protein